MADAIKELIIRIRKEVAPEGEQASERSHQAERKRIAATSMAATDAERKRTTAAVEGSRERATASRSEASSVGSSMVAAIGSTTAAVGALTLAATSALRQMREAAREANQYIDGVVASSAKVSAALAAINAQTGKTPGIGATIGQARAAQAAGVSPATFTANQKAYQASIGSYVGNKFTQAQSDKLLQTASTNAAAKGLDFGGTTSLIASMVGGSAPGTSAGQILANTSAVEAALRTVPGGDVNGLVKQFGELGKEQVGRGASAEDVRNLAPIFAGLASVMPNQAANTTRTMTRGIDQMTPLARAKYGLKEGQTGLDAMRTVVNAVVARMDQGERAGQFVAGDFKDVEDSEWRSIAKGLASPTLVNAMGAMAGSTPQSVLRENERWLNSPEGKRQAAEAAVEAAQRGQAAKYERLNLLKQQAAAKVAASGVLAKREGPVEEWARTSIFGWGAGGDRESDLVNAELRSGISDRLRSTELGRAAFSRLGGLRDEYSMARGDIAARLIDSGQVQGANRSTFNGYNQNDPAVNKLLQVVEAQLKATQEQIKATQEQTAEIKRLQGNGPPKALQNQVNGRPPDGPGRP